MCLAILMLAKTSGKTKNISNIFIMYTLISKFKAHRLRLIVLSNGFDLKENGDVLTFSDSETGESDRGEIGELGPCK